MLRSFGTAICRHLGAVCLLMVPQKPPMQLSEARVQGARALHTIVRFWLAGAIDVRLHHAERAPF